MNFMKIFAFMFVLLTQAANAALLTLNFEATDYFEQVSSYDDNGTYIPGRVDYTSISPKSFELNYYINFELAPSDSEFWDLNDHKGERDEEERDGKHYSHFTSVFRADLLTPTTPFTAQLQALMPKMDESPSSQSFNLPALRFFSTVVSDLATGEIIQEESYERFWLSDGFGFQNDIDDNVYEYGLYAWLILPTTFTSTEANSYDVQEIKEMLRYRQDYKVVFNEVLTTTTLSRVNLDRSGYVGNGTHTFDVPEPSSIAILTLGLIGLVSRRFKKL